MKKIIAVVLVFLFIIQYASAEVFSIRNGIKWGMPYDEVYSLVKKEKLTVTSRSNSDGTFQIECKNVPVSNTRMGMLLCGTEENGLLMVVYFHPDYRLSSKQMISDYDSFFEALTKKYGKADYSESFWEDDIFKEVYEEHTAANLGVYTRYASWSTKTCFVELALNSDLESIKDNLPAPTVWIGYYPPEFVESLAEQSISTDGL